MYVAMRDNMLGKVGSVSEEMNEFGINSVELYIGRDMSVLPVWGGGRELNLADPDDMDELKGVLDKAGLSVCGLLMGNDFSSGDAEGEVEWIMRTAEAAQKLGCGVIRIDLAPHQEMDPDDFFSACAQGMKRVIELTESQGVLFGIENHGSVSNNPEFLNRIMSEVGSDRLGLTLDTGNFYWYGTPIEEVYEIMKHFAPHVKHTHVKNIKYPEEMRNTQREKGWEYRQYVSTVYEGDIDHKRVADILKQAGYDGDICIEDESLSKCVSEEEKFEVLKKDVEHLKQCIG